MKKYINALAVSALLTTFINGANLRIISNNLQNSDLEQPLKTDEPLVKKIDIGGTLAAKFNENLAIVWKWDNGVGVNKKVIGNYFIDAKGKFVKELSLLVHSVWTMNDTLAVVSVLGDKGLSEHAEFEDTYFLDSSGNFTKLDYQVSAQAETDGDLIRWNDNLILFKKYNSSSGGAKNIWYLLDSSGNFTKLSKEYTFLRVAFLNDTLAVVWDREFRELSGEAFFLDSSGKFTPLYKKCFEFTKINDFTGVFSDDTEELYILDSSGSFKDAGHKGFSIQRFNDQFAIFLKRQKYETWTIDINCQVNKIANAQLKIQNYKLNDNQYVASSYDEKNSWFLDSAQNLTPLKQYINNLIQINENLLMGLDDNNNIWLVNNKGEFNNINLKGTRFLRMNEKNTFIFDPDTVGYTGTDIYLFTSPYSPEDLDKLKKSVKFLATESNQLISKVNVPKYQGLVSNNIVRLNITNKHATKVLVDGNEVGKTDDIYEKLIDGVGEHTIVVKNDLTSDLKYNLYLKKDPTFNTYTNTNKDKMNSYVGLDVNNNLIDVLQSPSQIQITFDDYLLKENKISTLNKNFKVIKTENIISKQTYSSFNNYLIETIDYVGNSLKQYITLGSKTIINYWDTKEGKDLWSKALDHKYKEEDLLKLKASEIIDLRDTSHGWKYPFDLANITSLTLGELTLNPKSKYIGLISTIINSKELIDKNGNKLINPTFKFFDMNDNDITNELEKVGDFQVRIEAAKEDDNFKGKTENITLHLSDRNFPNRSNNLSGWIIFLIAGGAIFFGVLVFAFIKSLWKDMRAKNKNKKNTNFVKKQKAKNKEWEKENQENEEQ